MRTVNTSHTQKNPIQLEVTTANLFETVSHEVAAVLCNLLKEFLLRLLHTHTRTHAHDEGASSDEITISAGLADLFRVGILARFPAYHRHQYAICQLQNDGLQR